MIWFKNSGFRLVFHDKSKILYISAAKWGCPIASYLLIARFAGAIRLTDCLVPDWLPDSIYWPVNGNLAMGKNPSPVGQPCARLVDFARFVPSWFEPTWSRHDIRMILHRNHSKFTQLVWFARWPGWLASTRCPTACLPG